MSTLKNQNFYNKIVTLAKFSIFQVKGEQRMTLIFCSDYEEMSRKAASIIAAQIMLKPDSTIGFATGATPIGLYENLVKKFTNNEISFSAVKAFNLDEYVGGNIDNEWSFASFMQKHLFSRVDILPENADIPDGTKKDLNVECMRYDAALEQISGGLDFQILGIGANGHIGFNEPGDSFPMNTHVVDLAQSSIDGQKPFFSDWSKIPTQGVTMGIKSIMFSKQILLVVSGKGKSSILEKSLFGPVTPKVPASILQLHKSVTVIADSEAFADIISKHPDYVG